ncbi:DoxX family membrane protein [Mycobacterium fragae]|uniref:DoxX family protein n=1 Tax=Mycobacterium fragae TaxID=1260918 RepID=A0A1X1UJT4_9MYCO|nr:DoxX family membrane protein [Mycobacterium fragae]MCV7400914.1 DoxX family membrane protein [Mycobacterium fragae]ORV57105.1 DoxX family protein [Mycobacterium fragae]
MLIRRIARPLLSAVFIGQGVETLRNPRVTADAAEPTIAALRNLPEPIGTNVPANPETAARLNAAVQVGGGVLLATGKLPRVASAALALTVIPGSLGAHLFWSESDPERKAQKRRDFFTDLSLLGGLIIASADTAGKPSLGWRGRRAAGRLSEAVASALPGAGSDSALLDSELGEKIGRGLQVGAERGRELASTAVEKSGPLVEAARKRGGELASTAGEKSAPVVEAARKRARKRGAQLAETVRERGAELAETARERGGEFGERARERGAELAAELAETARERGSEFGERARERSAELAAELAETARERGGELAARGRVKARRWR